MNRKHLTATLATLALTVSLTACGGQAGPNTAGGGEGSDFPKKGKTIELIVHVAPGGPVDTAARLVAPLVEEDLGTNVEVINKPGAGGQIGYTFLTSAKPDGYTIGTTSSPSVVVSPLDPSRGAKYTRESFRPLARQVIDPSAIAVASDSPYQTLKDLLEALKANPKSVSATTTGIQTGEHFSLAQIQQKTGAEFAPVHFSEGAAAATTAFLGKHVDVLMASVSDMTDLVKQGKVRVLGVLDEQRAPSLPDAPTFKEQGYDVQDATVRGYSAPAGIPDAVAEKLEAAFKKAIEDPTVVKKMADLGLQTSYQNGADYKEYWANQEASVKAALPLVQNQK
jgi:tripartite-type tricarboxylate transporter receptor subunit TctC